jgi:hypothetical protein
MGYLRDDDDDHDDDDQDGDDWDNIIGVFAELFSG